MSQEITPVKDERPILMKSGLVHWVKKDTWEKISGVLASQQAHSFIRISELGNLTINSAEIEGAYTVEQYQDWCKVKEGQWQCAYRKWHPKKGECSCEKEWRAEQRRKEEAKQREQDNRPLTEEERAANAEHFRKSNEIMILDKPDSFFRSSFVKGSRSGRKLRRSTIQEWEKKNGREANITGLAIEEDVEGFEPPEAPAPEPGTPEEIKSHKENIDEVFS